MKIYTKTGDNGLTSLYDCSRVSKASNLIDLLGDIDELNSFIGIINSEYLIKDIQTWLFDLGTIIANPNKKYKFDCNLEFTKILEKEIDKMTNELPKLKNFILPTGNIHLSRAITRRCERKLVEVKNNYQHIDDNCLIFINRLSDYLFTLARYDSYIKGLTENIYKKSTILQLCNEENK
jgi:cob(I)alamin adenosyltransferase